VDLRIGELKDVSKGIEKSIKAEYVGILERLKSAVGEKQAVLQHGLHNLQKDLERIDVIIELIEDYTRNEGRNDIVGFLIKFKEIKEFFEFVLNKTVHTRIDVVPNDLPRELTQRRKLLQRANMAELLLKLRDGIMWELIQEINVKDNFFEQYEGELEQYELICGYCGIALDEYTINKSCMKNRGEVVEEFLTVECPQAELWGSERHFFGKPLRSEQGFLRRVVLDHKAKNVLESLTSLDKSLIGQLVEKLYEIDNERKGHITQDQMLNILKELLPDTTEQNIKRLVVKLVPDNSLSKSVYYKGFIRYLGYNPLTELKKQAIKKSPKQEGLEREGSKANMELDVSQPSYVSESKILPSSYVREQLPKNPGRLLFEQ
jgi:hypothetical protein